MSPENKTCSRWHRHTAHYDMSQGFPDRGCESFSHHLHFSLRFCFHFCFSQVPTLPSHINSIQGLSSVPSHFLLITKPFHVKKNHFDSAVTLMLYLCTYSFCITAILSKWPLYWKLILTDFTPCPCSFLAGVEHKKSKQNTFFVSIRKLPHKSHASAPQSWLLNKKMNSQSAQAWRNPVEYFKDCFP